MSLHVSLDLGITGFVDENQQIKQREDNSEIYKLETK